MLDKFLLWWNEIFNDKAFYKRLMIIAIPITLQQLIGSSLNMIDTLMIGMIGSKELAAVGLANQFFLIILMGITGISSGAAIFTSQFWGKKDVENIRKVLGFTLLGVTVVTTIGSIFVFNFPQYIMRFFTPDKEVIRLGIDYLQVVSISYIFTAITFAYGFNLRSIGDSTLPMLVSILAVFINVFFNWVFIFGNLGAPVLGVKGAALATTIARVVETLVLVSAIYLRKGVMAAKFKELFSFSRDLIEKLVVPIMFVVLNELCWGLGAVVYSSAYGHISSDAAASVQISNTIVNLLTVTIFGLAGAASTMVGNKIGEGEEEEGKLYARRILVIGIIFAVVMSSVLAIGTDTIVNIFSVSDAVIKSSKTILYLTSAILILRTVNVLLIVGILRGGGDAKAALIIEAVSMWLVGVPMALLGSFVLKLPIEAVVAMVSLEELVKFILCSNRFRSGQWAHNIISDLPKGVKNIN